MIGRTFAVLLALAGVIAAWVWYGPWVALTVAVVYTVAAVRADNRARRRRPG